MLARHGMNAAEPAAVESSPEASAPSRSALRELFTRVSESCDLPPLPAVAVRAIALARDPNVGADQLVRVVSRDAALAARVVSIARSVRYMRREPPRTLDSAIQTYGSFDAARQYVQTPAASKHVTGQAVDIGGDAADQWLIANGPGFGLCRIYANEVWHFELAADAYGNCPPLRPNAAF